MWLCAMQLCAMQMAKCLECLLLTHFLAKTIFSRGYGGGVQNSNGNSGGLGGVVLEELRRPKGLPSGAPYSYGKEKETHQ